MKFARSALPYLVLIFFIAGFIFFNNCVKERRDELGARYSLGISSAPPEVIDALAGEFSGVIGDYLLLQIGSFVGSNTKITRDQWKMIHRGFQQVYELDPYFKQAYLYAQALLAWEAQMPEAAIALMKISRQKRPWDWRPGYYLGFDYYYFLKDFEKASEVYLETAKIKNAPPIIAMLGGRFAVKGQRVQASINALEIMLKDPEIADRNKEEIRERIQVLKNIRVLNSTIKQYKLINNDYPPNLKELVAAGFIDKIPEAPSPGGFKYDPETGEVGFD